MAALGNFSLFTTSLGDACKNPHLTPALRLPGATRLVRISLLLADQLVIKPRSPDGRPNALYGLKCLKPISVGRGYPHTLMLTWAVFT